MVILVIATIFIAFKQISISNEQTVISEQQKAILGNSSLSIEPNLRVWWEGRRGINNSIPRDIEGLTTPKQGIGTGVATDFYMRNLALYKLSYLRGRIIGNDLFESSSEIIYDLGLERQLMSIRIRQKGCGVDQEENCNPNLFKEGEIKNIKIEFEGEDKVWIKDFNICLYKLSPQTCLENKIS